MILIKAGVPLQRMTSDGFPFTDRVDGEMERAEMDYIVYNEAILLEPEENNGKWLLAMGTAMLWEVADEDIKDGRVKRDSGGTAGTSP